MIQDRKQKTYKWEVIVRFPSQVYTGVWVNTPMDAVAEASG
jgi:hypothetical protein